MRKPMAQHIGRIDRRSYGCSTSLWRLVVCAPVILYAGGSSGQTGPLNPSSGTNDTSIGTLAWSSPNNILASDNSRATQATRGITNFLAGTGFGFTLSEPAAITGIQLDIERSTSAVNNVAILGSSPFWTTGLSRPTLPTGVNRCLIVVAAMENGDGFGPRDITAMTYGGRAMTQLTQVSIGGGSSFSATLEVWMMLEADLALASGTAITRTYAASPGAHNEFCETFSSAVFQHVDQVDPVVSIHTSGSTANTNPHQLGANITTLPGSAAVNAVVCGNRPSSDPAPNTSTTGYTINSSYVEGTDFYFANASTAPNSGATLQVAHKLISSAGTERPTCTFNGNVNRHVMVGFTLQSARELDHAVHLLKAGNPVGDNKANTVAWPTTDTYISYGGPADLWGTTWTVAEVNNNQFGAALSARVQSATARVDHMRATVYWMSTLPVELLDFTARRTSAGVQLDWATASEQQNSHFIVEHGHDGVAFTELARVPGAGWSQVLRTYSALDPDPMPGINYYRLVQVDLDGTTALSPIVAVEWEASGPVVYPNPTPDGRVSLFDVELRPGTITVFDAGMRWVKTFRHMDEQHTAVDLGDLPDGSYLLLMSNPEGTRHVRVVKSSLDR